MTALPEDEHEARHAVLEHLAAYTSTPLSPDDDGDVRLSSYGLDSFGIFEFILSLESRFGVTIGDEYLDARRLQSVNGIVEILRQLRSGADGQ